MRKLVSVGALLFMLSVAFLSKPAIAMPLCDCDLCSYSPNTKCMDDEHFGFVYFCHEYTYFYCT